MLQAVLERLVEELKKSKNLSIVQQRANSIQKPGDWSKYFGLNGFNSIATLSAVEIEMLFFSLLPAILDTRVVSAELLDIILELCDAERALRLIALAESDIRQLEGCYARFNTKYARFYGEDAVTSKMHALLHLGYFLRLLGPHACISAHSMERSVKTTNSRMTNNRDIAIQKANGVCERQRVYRPEAYYSVLRHATVSDRALLHKITGQTGTHTAVLEPGKRHEPVHIGRMIQLAYGPCWSVTGGEDFQWMMSNSRETSLSAEDIEDLTIALSKRLPMCCIDGKFSVPVPAKVRATSEVHLLGEGVAVAGGRLERSSLVTAVWDDEKGAPRLYAGQILNIVEFDIKLPVTNEQLKMALRDRTDASASERKQIDEAFASWKKRKPQTFRYLQLQWFWPLDAPASASDVEKRRRQLAPMFLRDSFLDNRDSHWMPACRVLNRFLIYDDREIHAAHGSAFAICPLRRHVKVA